MKSLAIVAVVVAVAAAWWICAHPRAADDPPGPQPQPPAPRYHVVYVSSKKCAYCDKMERQTLTDPRVAQRLAANHTFVKLTTQEARERNYVIDAYPTYLLLHDAREIRRGTGYRSPDEFLAWLDGHGEVKTGNFTCPTDGD